MTDDTETQSLRDERGKPPLETPAERMADVPLAPHSAGVVGGPPETGDVDASDADDRAEAADRERPG